MFTRIHSIAAIFAGAAASLLLVASPLTAQNTDVVVRGPEGINIEAVPYGDLNLIHSAQQSVLYQRVGRAVRHVCSYDDGTIPIIDNDYRVCRNDAWAGARPQISNAITMAHYMARDGRSPSGVGYIVVDNR